MKKRLLYLFVLVALTGYNAKGQVTFTKDWEIKPAATGSLIGIAGSETTIAYNKVTHKLYLPERNNKISILKPDGTLSSPATLTTLTPADHEGWGKSYKYTKIRVTSDGVIYACNMTTGAGVVYIYRWASETDAAPTVSSINVDARTGDSFAVSGTGTGTIIYLSGSSNNEIYVCNTVNGKDFALHHKITGIGGSGTATEARSSISPVTNSLTSDLWINTLNVEARRISSNAAGVITDTKSIATSLIDQKYSNAEYFEEGGDKYLAVSGAHDAVLGLNFKLYKITSFAMPSTASVTEVGSAVLAPTAYTANLNAYADVAFVKNVNGTYTFYHLDTNNGLAAYTSEGALPVSLSDFTASIKNGRNTLIWKTHSESNNDKFEVQRSGDGQNFETIATVYSKAENGNSNTVLDYQYIDENPLSGINYYRLKQLDKDGSVNIHAVKSINNGLSAITVSPNPTKDIVFISNAAQVALDYQVTDIAGKVILSGKSVNSKIEVSLKDLKPAIYLVKVLDSGQLTSTFKVIKQ
ncbi:T9SS type A sorting domain-containing protein [Pseudopedobacter beijingensis]|uniref:T9SS type A sorting domain-containing protein n=1 Tax=Pseudopedobacter beijingensis TaxID=1207056 RepID=A0ABW4IEA9_9SPHI